MSRIIQSSGTASAATVRVGTSASSVCAMTTSVGNVSVVPAASQRIKTSAQKSTRSGSNNDLPMPSPLAFKNVAAIPPPTNNASAWSMRRSSTLILSLTFAPPSSAARGRLGS